MVPRGDHFYRIRLRTPEILIAAEQHQVADRHTDIRFSRKTFERTAQDGVLDRLVRLNPAGGVKRPVYLGFRADDQKIDAVAGVALAVGDARGDAVEHLLRELRQGGIRYIDG